MLQLIKKLLLKIISDIDAGNSNVTEEEACEIIKYINSMTNREQRLSKYQVCQALNISRATLDNYIREGKFPKGSHTAGFKELSWNKKDLDEYLKGRL